ncbi:MAG: hypothetical protein N2512_01670 [Armatimonadetes bacterium]|nr:hypothetical protein [Armatimonadota bacterium]
MCVSNRLVMPVTLLVVAGGGLVLVGGCARGGPSGGPSPVPEVVVDVDLTFAGPVNDSYYYFIAIDADDDINDGPVPVAAGPYWGNGWGAGSYTHYVQYNQGVYQVFRQVLAAQLRTPGGGITAVSGTPQWTDTGTVALTVGQLTLGTATVSGTGMIASVTNNSDQNAGTLTVQTDDAGNIVAGSVTFTPASDGGRPLSQAEAAQLAALNAGGVALTANSFAFVGLSLTLGPPAAGSQTITVAPTTAVVTARFVGDSPPQQTRDATGTLTANSSTPTATPPVPGLSITAGELVPGGSAEVKLVTAPGVLLGTPYDYTLPNGTSALRVTLDLGQLSDRVQYLSLNFISTVRLLFDPQATERDHVYDGLGPRGNDYITVRIGEYGTWRNGEGFIREGANDPTLQYAQSEQEKAGVDLVDWRVRIRRL